ncbi:DUF4167 domain-containing protein [Aristophania vespae]|uniref:DUF4167 domain-containing protein n=1 Tax=Aristophania vespae TaxID=2697033 RepID=A0A6P1NFI6_9PROT|nr:DUF4167 domain-containing protein [Aristophania vespae]QHI95667.1 DUF4167 domain-containing protein [Aristophania vespae]UMM63350.1 hypothetical protein DM15PD_03090 [Aristophania vespae]
MKRMRSRHHRTGSGGGSSRNSNGQMPLNRNHVFESNGPDLRVRGTAQQLFEKYLQLGRDATGTGDRIQAEAYFQHAEHYFRTLNAMNLAAQSAQQERAERQRSYEQARMERREQSMRDGRERGDASSEEEETRHQPHEDRDDIDDQEEE